ncbi:hypothetical protein HAX54_036076, partial [Datura stramonium]|nr:hypothetical protein [Datura stramonium]
LAHRAFLSTAQSAGSCNTSGTGSATLRQKVSRKNLLWVSGFVTPQTPGVKYYSKGISCRPGTWVIEEVTSRHTSDGRSDGTHPGDAPSLVPLRSSPLNLWATEVSTDHQVSDSLSRKPSLTPEVQVVLVKEGRRADNLSGV